MNVRTSTRRLTLAAVFMALNIVMSSFGIPVPGGHLYMNDIVICTAALLFDPVSAFLIGGVGAFLGDLFFYPTPMFVSLVTHGVQAVVISLFAMWSRRIAYATESDVATDTAKKRFFTPYKCSILISALGVTVGAVIMVVGYSLGRAFIYSTPEYAWLKLPYQIAQALVGAVLGMVLCYGVHLDRVFNRYIRQGRAA